MKTKTIEEECCEFFSEIKGAPFILLPIDDAADLIANPPDTKNPCVKEYSGYIELLIYSNGNGYPIEYDRMDTPAKVLGWIHHLCGKTNVTKQHILEFIQAAKKLGVDVNFNA